MVASINRRPKQCDLALVPGDEFPFTLRFKTGTLPASPPVNLTGYTFVAKVYAARVKAGVTTPTLGQELITINFTVTPAEGKIDLWMDETQTATFNNANVLAWRWYLRWVTPGGETRTIISGAIIEGAP